MKKKYRDMVQRFLQVVFVLLALLPIVTFIGLVIALLNGALLLNYNHDQFIIVFLMLASLVPLIAFLLLKYALKYIIYGSK